MKTHTASNLFRLSSSVACLLVASTVMAQGTNNAPPSSDVPGANSASPAVPPGQPAPPPPESYPPAPAAYPPAPAAYPPAPAAYPPARARRANIESPEPSEEAETHNPRTLAIGLTTLKEHGFGVMVRARANHVAGDLAVGFNPILVVGSGGSSAVDFGMPLQASIGPVFIFSNDQSTFQNGIRINGIYNRAVGPGGGLGWVGEITKAHFTIAFGFGLQIYPQATKRVKEYFPDLQGTELSSSPPPEVQIYVGVNLFWYII